MLATLVIGLREGLEAALIVGIIAAFLRTNGRRLTQMWLGVGAAVALSIAVGAGLAAAEQALPQAAQEALETVVGAIAVVFVTGMIVWMNRHSRGLKRELEAQAGAALKDSHAWALAGMAFLAVLKEGFETSVFLLATFSAATSTVLAAVGALIGIGIAVAIGFGIYAGSVKINLSRFFRITGTFLILVAAGLVMQTLRTAHEAGWVTAGQGRVADLSSFAGPGTVPSALLTGVLGIPADPRVIEVVGWAAYLVPVALVIYWPAGRRATGRSLARLQLGVAAALVVGAVALFVGVARMPASAAQPPASVTLQQLTALDGGRVPVGIDPQRNPGPFTARWSPHGDTATLTLTDGGLTSSRTVTVPWAEPASDDGERTLWGLWVPLAALFAAAITAAYGLRSWRRSRTTSLPRSPDPKEQPAYAIH